MTPLRKRTKICAESGEEMKQIPGLAGLMLMPVFAGLAGCQAGESAAGMDIPALMDAASVPGLAIAIVDDCEVAEVSYFGTADVSGAAVSADTVFEAASLTKTIFSVIVSQLASEGIIELDEPLAASFEYSRVVDQEAYARLTPRMILEHRSGFPNWAGDPLDPETWGPIDFKNPPDTAFGYSGEAFQMLQAFVEMKSGKSLEQLFEERFGMVMPHTSLSALKPGTTPAFGHDENGGAESGRALIASPDAGAAYSAATNADDYAAFLVNVFCNGAGMSAETRSEMLRPQSPTDDEAIFWALGWGVQVSGDRPVHFHWGDNGPFKAFAAFDSETGDGIVYFANAMNGLQLIEPLAEPAIGDVTPIADWLDYGRVDLAGRN